MTLHHYSIINFYSGHVHFLPFKLVQSIGKTPGPNKQMLFWSTL